jgi:glycosyltransferase 2 family protein
MSAQGRSWIKTVLKIAFVLGLLYYLTQKGFISARETGKAFMNWPHSLPALIGAFVSAGLGVVRWQLLLRAQGIHLSWKRTTQLTFIGNFFNIALPGAVSGDFVKAFYVGKEVGGQRARSFGSILFDRVAGLSALVLIAASALLAAYGEFKGSPLVSATRVFIVTGAACVLVFYAYLFLVRENGDPVLKLLKALEGRIGKARSLTQIYLGLRHYHSHRMTVLQVLGVSVIIQLLIGWVCWHFAMALGEPELAPLAIYVVVPLGLLVTAVPVAPAGVGTGHAAFLFLFGLLGSQRGADVFSLIALSNILIGALGGLIYLRFRSYQPAPTLVSADHPG